jgi:DtxR family Mn-dependent transcriptional regulator
MHLSPEAEDYLERLYMQEVEEDVTPPAPDDRVLGELLRRSLLRPLGETPRLTKEGKLEAEGAVRRHRLAERLLHDVLAVQDRQMNAAACQFEHSLHHGVAEHICALLGHPTTCPHGRPIPPGRCCRERKVAATALIAPLTELKNTEHGVIAYLSSRQTEAVQKLMSLGVVPGAALSVIQTFPSIVFQIGQTQIAVDAKLAGDIYVRRESV